MYNLKRTIDEKTVKTEFDVVGVVAEGVPFGVEEGVEYTITREEDVSDNSDGTYKHTITETWERKENGQSELPTREERLETVTYSFNHTITDENLTNFRPYLAWVKGSSPDEKKAISAMLSGEAKLTREGWVLPPDFAGNTIAPEILTAVTPQMQQFVQSVQAGGVSKSDAWNCTVSITITDKYSGTVSSNIVPPDVMAMANDERFAPTQKPPMRARYQGRSITCAAARTNWEYCGGQVSGNVKVTHDAVVNEGEVVRKTNIAYNISQSYMLTADWYSGAGDLITV